MSARDLLLGIFLALLLLRGITAWVEHRLLYKRRRVLHTRPEDVGLEAEDLRFCAEDGCNLHGWWFEHPEARGVMVICHGNAGNLADRLWMAQTLQDLPLHLFIFDYRGFGESEGIPREAGTGRDVRAALEVSRQRWQARTGSELPGILLYGRSLGGAIALQAATDASVRALILESTFTSISEMGDRFYPWLLPRLLCMNPYRSDQRLGGVQVPVLVAHSPMDEVIPYDMGERLYSLAPKPWRFLPLQGSHDEAGWVTSPEYAAAIHRLVAETFPPPPQSS